MNIEKPLGRILIKPYELIRKGYMGLSKRPIVYSPEPTVYSSYVGLENVVEYLNKLCENIEELNNKNYMIRSSGERMALNTPIQGTAADILKKAMIEIFDEFKKRNLKSMEK